MPRLTDRDYLFIRAYLTEVWHTKQQAFSLISTTDQWYVHQYFRPSEHLSTAELLEHRKTVSGEQPSLPQCAGRALQHLANPRPLRRARGSNRIVVYPVLRPEIDVTRLIRSLMDLL